MSISKQRLAAIAFAVSALGGAVAPSHAATVTFNNLTGGFYDGTLQNAGSPAISYGGAGTAATTARFGIDAGSGRSGYDFATAASIATSVVPPALASDTVILGTFAHVNVPISAGTSITGMKLRFNADVAVDGVSRGPVQFVYDFVHNETPNAATPCAFGGDNAQGVNINGCADRVTVNFNSASDSFRVGRSAYTLDVVGFVSGVEAPVTGFLTVERQTSNAFIIGRLALVDAVVPEPATWAMLIGGFGLVGAAARRRRGTNVVAA